MSWAASQPAGGVSRPAGLCVFDIDSTLTRQRHADPSSCGIPLRKIPNTPECTNCVGNFPPTKREIVGLHTYPAPYAASAVQRCLAQNYAVGIATARPCRGSTVDARLKWLDQIGLPKELVDRDPATGVPTPGKNFMCAASDHPDNVQKKFANVKLLMDRVGVPASKTIFFDDNMAALQGAKQNIPGIHTQVASSYCRGQWCARGCGLTKDEFEKGFAKTNPGESPK